VNEDILGQGSQPTIILNRKQRRRLKRIALNPYRRKMRKWRSTYRGIMTMREMQHLVKGRAW
jgi:hypothetical protein